MAMKNGRIPRKFAIIPLVVLGLFLLAAYASAGGGSEAAAGAKGTPQSGSSGNSSDPGGGPSAGLKPYGGSATIIASTNASAQAVTLDIVGSQRGSSNSFNFNGYSNGDMVIKIPAGWKVTVHYTVQGSLAHSAIIAPWSQRQASSFTKAFPGSAMPDYRSGITSGDPPATFSFTASSAGKYAIVCAVPGHDDLGMWDELDVVGGLAKPEVLVK